VELESVNSSEDIEELKQLIQQHADYTGSRVATGILESWEQSLSQFVKVMPRDYKRALAEMAAKSEVAAATN
jgi:glutamate synthase domain-containing protein 3